MVRLRETPPPPEDSTELLQLRRRNREIYKTFLKELLEDHLPPHDKAQDDLLETLPQFIFLPEDATNEQVVIYEKLCAKKDRLLRLQQQRDMLTMWLWAFYNEEYPDVTHQECQVQELKLVASKKRFYRVGKQVKKWLFRLHSVYPIP